MSSSDRNFYNKYRIRKKFAEITQRQLRRYAAEQNYDLIIYQEPITPNFPLNPWQKVLAIEKHLKDYHAIVWIDDDIYMTNLEISFDGFATIPDYDLIFMREWDGRISYLLNTGLFVVRNTPGTKRFLRRMLELFWDWPILQENALWEQSIANLLFWTEFTDNALLIPQCVLQSYWTVEWGSRLVRRYQWLPGHFSIHLSNTPNAVRLEMLKMIEKNLSSWAKNYAEKMNNMGCF